MEENGRKKRNIVIISCIAAGICLAGIAAAVSAVQKNPLTKGLLELSEELAALEAEMGEHFWTDAFNQIGSGNIQAEYSLNIGGIPELENLTVGIDGKSERDMEEKILNTEVDISIANAEMGKLSLTGTEDVFYVQAPSVWEGSVVLDTENVSGQWNDSAMRKGLELLTGEELGIDRRIDAEFFAEFSVDSFSFAGFLEENREALRDLYKNMEVIKIGKAEKRGMLSGEQAEFLRNTSPENGEGEVIETTCYLVILPEKELKRIFSDIQGDIKLCVYLDSGKRVVKICTLPGEFLAAKLWEGEAVLNLTGLENVTDRVEAEFTGKTDGAETRENILIVKSSDRAGAYRVEWDASLLQGENAWNLSLEGSVQGERINAEESADTEKQGENLFIEVENFVLKSQGEVICRGSGEAEFAPLAGEIRLPAGKEYRPAEMNELEAVLFLAECTKNVYDNYSGYLRLLR